MPGPTADAVTQLDIVCTSAQADHRSACGGYLRFPISFAHMAEMALERGLLIHSGCIWRVQIFGPELDKRCRAHLKRTNKSDFEGCAIPRER